VNHRGQNLLSRLGRLLGISPIPADVAEEMAALRAEVGALAQSQVEHQDRAAALREAIEKLEKQVARAGKEQFKTNALAEVQQQSVKSVLEQLREANAYRERELAQLRERLVGARAEGRTELIHRLLPVLDGLDEALNAGRRLLHDDALQQSDALAEAHRGLPFRQRLSGAWALLAGRLPDESQSGFHSAPSGLPTRTQAGDEAVRAWLEGLEFVRDRLLDVLSAEGVRPIETEGEIFDPHLHVAVEAAPATDGVPAGSIVQEARRGYLAGDTVLRYAEVVVAR